MFTTKSSPRSSNDRHHLRAWSAVLCALFLLAQITSFAHEVLNDHAVCAEHGELVHVDRACEGVPSSATASRQVAGATLSQSTSVPTPQHEHCGLATLNRERALEFQDCTSLAVAPACSVAPNPVQTADEHGSIPLLLLAPKQSPPL